MIIIIGTVLYIILLGFLLYQETDLKRELSSPAWSWDVAGFASAFVGLLLRIGATLLFDVPMEWRYALTFINSVISIICLIISRVLLKKSLRAVLKNN